MMALAILFCAALALFVILSLRKNNDAQLVEPLVASPTMGIQIICGNCSGEGERPIRTFLNRYGDCERCGGHSYVLASHAYVNRWQKINEAAEAFYRASTGGRVKTIR